MIIEFIPHPALRKAVFGLRDTTGQFRAFCYKLKIGYGVDIIVKGKPRNGAQFNEAKEAKAWAKEQLIDLIEWAV